MAEKFVPYEKMSKRSRRKIDRQKRRDWGGVNPIPRIVPDKRRKLKEKAEEKE